MSKQPVKIYIGCALTQAPDDFRRQVEALKDQLRNDYEILDFFGLEKGTPNDVYHWDIHRNIAQCDLFVAICDLPSIGLGYELGVAVEQHHKPVLALAHKDARITRLVRGIEAPGFSFKRYANLSEVPRLIREIVSAPNLQETAHE